MGILKQISENSSLEQGKQFSSKHCLLCCGWLTLDISTGPKVTVVMLYF